MAKAETWTWRDLITPATVLIIGVIAVTVFTCELRGIETRLADVDSKIANVDAKIDRRGEAVEQHLTETDKRLAETNNRLELGLDRQADMSSKINKIDADLSFIHERIDKLDEPKARGSTGRQPRCETDRSTDGCTGTRDGVRSQSEMQADSPQFSELCASVLKPANLSGGSQTWKLLELTPLRPTALSCNLDQGGDNESYQKDVLGRLADITPGAWHASPEATNELNGRVGVSGYTVNRYHHPTPMRGARMMNLTRSRCL